jgi:hypothetical protein
MRSSSIAGSRIVGPQFRGTEPTDDEYRSMAVMRTRSLSSPAESDADPIAESQDVTRHNKSNPEPVPAADADDQGPMVSPTVDPYLVSRHRPNYDDAQTNQVDANATRQATQDSVVRSHRRRLSDLVRRGESRSASVRYSDGSVLRRTPRCYVRLLSMVSRMMSAWPACRAVSSIMCTATHRRFPALSGHAHGASRSTVLRISCEAAICSR